MKDGLYWVQQLKEQKVSRTELLKDIEKKYIKKAIEIYGDSTEGKKIAAKKLGIGIATLYRRLEQ